MSIAPMTYLNACSHGLPDASCAEAIADQALRAPGMYDREAEIRANARKSCATLLAADPADVGLGAGTFQLWSAIMGRVPLRRGRILMAQHEWGDHVRWLQRVAASTDVTLDVIAKDAFDPSAWAQRMDDDVIAICLPMVTSIAGLRYPVSEISAVARPSNALVIVDAAQALGRVCVNAAEIGCDVIVGTARKWLRGPRQTAVFWMSQRAQRVLNCGVRDIEPLDLNSALLAGLAQAANLANAHTIPVIKNEIAYLDAQLRSGLEDAGNLELVPTATPGTILCKVALDAREACDARLRERGVVAKWCNTVRDEPLSNDGIEAAFLRLSPHVYNTDSDIAIVVDALSAEGSG